MAHADWLGPRVSGHLALFCNLSNEPGELLQWLCHDDSTINIVVSTTITITHVVLYVHSYKRVQDSGVGKRPLNGQSDMAGSAKAITSQIHRTSQNY